MVRASPMQTNFTAGEFSPLLEGHINIERHPNSVLLLQRMIALKQGPATRSAGTKFITEVKDSSKETVLIPFEYSVDQAYHIEAGDSYFRFIRDNAQILDGGSAYEVSTPYADTDLTDSNLQPKFQYAQSANALYLTVADFAPRVLFRNADTDWTLTEMEFTDGPYLPENDEDTTLALSGTTGSVTVTASAVTGINTISGTEGFKSTDVGRLIRWKDPANNWTWLEITAFTSTTVVTATIKGEDPSAGTATNDWRLGVYSETTGYPKVITFFQDRVFLAGAWQYPDRYDLTKTGGYSSTFFNFAPTDRDGTVTDDAAINGTLQSGQINTIHWANEDGRGLVIGTYDNEWILRPDSSNGVLTPTNSKADKISGIGSAYIQPFTAESGTIFIQRARRKVHDLIYNYDRDQLKPRDIVVVSEHITKTGISQIVFQQEPFNVIWMRRTDGLLIGLTYYPDESVFAAHRHPLGGTDAMVKSLSIIPSADESRDELTMIVERTVDGSTVKYIEYMMPLYERGDDKEDAFYVDSGVTYDSTATDTVTGLDHLEGEVVKLMVDGNSHPDLTVSGGSVTLGNNITGSVIQVGLGSTWVIKLQRQEAGSKDGVSQGKIKKVQGIVVRLLDTLGLKYGPSADDLEEYDFEQAQSYDESLALYSGDTPYLTGPFGYDTDGFIYLSHDGVFPATVSGIMPQVITEDRG